MKRLSILGSTGSIGTQALDVCRRLGYKVVALAAGSNVELMEKQAKEFMPKLVAMYD
ncbi:MAG: 1-deoxy-D-xylulose-5-phosphate reductoisomerase, partial [Oscillospiraceae bacterium]|nr:1-deoxy-D-xylulose-5-phosphate reductoisomerase [Oscillospiraceae bacterium]